MANEASENSSSGNGRQTSPVFRPPSGLLDRRLRVSMALALLNSLALIGCVMAAARTGKPLEALQHILGMGLSATLVDGGAYAGYLLEAGQYWRLLAAPFLHMGILHLALNMMALVFFSVWMEALLGHWRYLTLVLCSGAAGYLFSYGVEAVLFLSGAPVWGLAPSVGASPCVFGLAGAMLASEWVAHGSLRAFAASPYWKKMLSSIFFIALLGFFAPGVDGWSHVGGLLAGLALGLFFFSRLSASPRPGLRTVGLNALYALVAACAVSAYASTRPVQAPRERDEAVLMLLGDIYGKPALALAWAETKADASGDSLFWLRTQAKFLLATRRYKEARTKVDQAIAMKDDDPLALYYSGMVRWRLEDLTRAEAELARAVTLAKDQAASGSLPLWVDAAEMSRVVTLDRLGQSNRRATVMSDLVSRLKAEARQADRMVPAARRDSATASTTKGLGRLADLGRQRAHEKELTAAIKRNHIAWLYAVMGVNLDEGLALIDKAIAVTPDAAFLDTRGWLWYRKGEYGKALADLLLADEWSPIPSAEIHYHLGATLAAMGQYVDAKGYLEEALRAGRDFDALGDATRMLEELGPTSRGQPRQEDLAQLNTARTGQPALWRGSAARM